MATTHVGVAEHHGGQVRRAVNLDERDVRLRVAADDLGLELLAGQQLDDDLVRVLDDVVVGEDVTLGIDDEARPEALRLVGSPRLSEELLERFEELVERITLSATATATGSARDAETRPALHLLRARDVDDGGGEMLREAGEVGECDRGRRARR